MALELGLGTLPCSTERDRSDTEPKSTPTPLLLALGLGESTAEGGRDCGRDWPFQSGRNHPRSRGEAAHLQGFYLIISNANTGMLQELSANLSLGSGGKGRETLSPLCWWKFGVVSPHHQWREEEEEEEGVVHHH